MKELTWMEKLIYLSKCDPLYLECLETLQSQEPGFQTVMEALPENQRKVIDDYISACEQLDHVIAQLAYVLGELEQKNLI